MTAVFATLGKSDPFLTMFRVVEDPSSPTAGSGGGGGLLGRGGFGGAKGGAQAVWRKAREGVTAAANGGRGSVIYKSEIVMNTLAPKFQRLKRRVTAIPTDPQVMATDLRKRVLIQIYDWDADDSHDLIGQVAVTFLELQKLSRSHMPLELKLANPLLAEHAVENGGAPGPVTGLLYTMEAMVSNAEAQRLQVIRAETRLQRAAVLSRQLQNKQALRQAVAAAVTLLGDIGVDNLGINMGRELLFGAPEAEWSEEAVVVVLKECAMNKGLLLIAAFNTIAAELAADNHPNTSATRNVAKLAAELCRRWTEEQLKEQEDGGISLSDMHISHIESSHAADVNELSGDLDGDGVIDEHEATVEAMEVLKIRTATAVKDFSTQLFSTLGRCAIHPPTTAAVAELAEPGQSNLSAQHLRSPGRSPGRSERRRRSRPATADASTSRVSSSGSQSQNWSWSHATLLHDR